MYGAAVSYDPRNLVDGNPATAWRTKGDGKGQRLVLTFARPVRIWSVGMIPGYRKTYSRLKVNWFPLNRRVARVIWFAPNQPEIVQRFTDRPELQIERVGMAPTRTLTVTIMDTLPGAADHDFTAISEIRIEGIYSGG